MREALGFLYIQVYFRAASRSRDVLCLCSPAVLGEALQGVGWTPAGASWSSTTLPPLSAQLLNLFSFQTNGPHWNPIPAGVLRATFITCYVAPVLSLYLYFCSVPQNRLQDLEKHEGLYCASSQEVLTGWPLKKRITCLYFFFPLH